MSDINRINLSLLKSYKDDFDNEKNNFNNKSYNTFTSSYLYKSSDSYVNQMASKLNELYKTIQKGYTNIDNWWSDYNSNVENLENTLSSGSTLNTISEISVRNSVNSLPELEDYEIRFAGMISSVSSLAASSVISSTSTKVNETSYDSNEQSVAQSENDTNDYWSELKEIYSEDGVGAVFASLGNSVLSAASNVANEVSDFFEETQATITEKFNSKLEEWNEWLQDPIGYSISSVKSDISNAINSVIDVDLISDWWEDDALPWIQDAASTVWNVLKSVGADIALFTTSLVEGILEFGEALFDFVELLGAVVLSPFLGLVDAGQAIYGAATGNEWSSVTKSMWSEVMGVVSTEYVSGWFDGLYENTAYGQWVATNAYAFDTVRDIGSGIGYIAGIVLLTIATFGSGSAVATVGGTTSAGVSAGITLGTAATEVTGATITLTTSAIGSGAIATMAGIGKNTESAWNDGAGLLEGLAYGGAMGVWEGFEMTFGYAINSFKLVQGTGLSSQIINSLSHVVLDSIDGATSTGTSSLLQMIYCPNEENLEEIMYLVNYDSEGNQINDKSWDDLSFTEKWNALFEYNGGWSAVASSAASAGIFSLLSELPDVFSAATTTKAVASAAVSSESIKLSDAELYDYMERYNNLLDSDNTLKEIMIARGNGETISIPTELMDSYQELTLLESVIKSGSISSAEKSALDGLSTKILSEVELQNYMNRYNTLLDSDDALKQIMMDRSKGLGISVPENLMDSYQELTLLESIIKSGSITSSQKSVLDELTNRIVKYSTPEGKLEIFKEKMLKDGQSDSEAIDLMYNTFKDAIDNGNLEALAVLETITELKRYNPDLKLVLDNDAKCCCWRSSTSSIVIKTSTLVMEDSATITHELGHCLFDSVLDGKLPDDWDSIVSRARSMSSRYIPSSEDTAVSIAGNVLLDTYDKKYEEALSSFTEQLKNSTGLSIDEYQKLLANQYSESLGELSGQDLYEIFKKYNLSDSKITEILSGYTDLSDLADIISNMEIKRGINSIAEELYKTQAVDLCALSDIIDAVYEGSGQDLNGESLKLTANHGKAYYEKFKKKGEINAPFHEIIANFTQLKITSNSDVLDEIKFLFGEEFYNTLEDVFSNFCYN